MKKARNKRKLRNYLFVNKAQVTIGISNLVMLMLMVCIVVATILSPLYSDMFRQGDLYARHLSSKLFIVTLERGAIAFGIMLLLLFLHQVLVVHKICGPLESFKLTIDKMSRLDFTRKIFLRRLDFFKEEAVQINTTLETMSTVIIQLHGHQERAVAALDRVPQAGELTREMEAILSSIAEQTLAARDVLSEFTVIEEKEENS